MRTVECGHPGAAFGTAVCPHLLPPPDSWGLKYVRWLSGVDLEVDLLCLECASDRLRDTAISLVGACTDCHARLLRVAWLQGTHGGPPTTERLESIDTVVVETPLPGVVTDVLSIAAASGIPGVWLVLSADGALVRFNATTGEWNEVGALEMPVESDHTPWANHPLTPHLHVCATGDFAAVVNDYGRRGAVYDLRTSRLTLELDGGDDHANTVRFSFGFVEHDGLTVAIHRTAWNRLDASDAATGALLSQRGPTAYSRGEQRPEHYLDYFHGGLFVSPNGGQILDDGWVWQPFGVPAVWETRAWLVENPWESEDGPTKLYLAQRGYYWDRAMCWLGDDRVAIGGIGDDDLEIYDGARIFETGKAAGVDHSSPWSAHELASFPGPGGTFFSDGRRLFSANELGLSVWAVKDGARTAHIAGFSPTLQHRASRELVQVSERVLRRWRY